MKNLLIPLWMIHCTTSFLISPSLIIKSRSQLNSKNFSRNFFENISDPLILTPYIQRNQIEEARKAAEVHLDVFGNLTSYSGYFTVDHIQEANLFFWFFPSVNDYKNDPVILWLQGGPGASSLYGLFTENGPVFIDENDEVKFRNYSWHKNYSILYIDQPIGTGFSFTKGPLNTNQEQIAQHTHYALLQFFSIFSELKSNEFYIAGESYAGKYIPRLGFQIYASNSPINLKGLLIGNGLTDPINQLNYGDLLFQLGLIDFNLLNDFHYHEKNAISYILNNNYIEAKNAFDMIIRLFHRYVQVNIYNYLQKPETDLQNQPWVKFLNGENVISAIHVGNQQFQSQNSDVYRSLTEDFYQSEIGSLITLLDVGCRVLIYSGQLDIIVGYPLTENYLLNLNFKYRQEYLQAQRELWIVNGEVAGYIKKAGYLTEVMVRNAGHMVPADQPENAYNLISRFIRNDLN